MGRKVYIVQATYHVQLQSRTGGAAGSGPCADRGNVQLSASPFSLRRRCSSSATASPRHRPAAAAINCTPMASPFYRLSSRLAAPQLRRQLLVRGATFPAEKPSSR